MRNGYEALEKAVEALSRGGIVIVVDSSERENEGDFLALADTIRAEQIHFMAAVGRGHLCLSIAEDIAARLELNPLVAPNDLQGPCFAMPIDHKDCGTGISPIDRQNTVRQVMDDRSGPQDFLRPGHIFPLIARSGGVLKRPGHTEAAIDLARLAGRSPGGVLCEICSSDGRNMASRQELEALGRQYQLPIVAIDALIRYRREFSPEFETIDATRELSAAARIGRRLPVPVDASDEAVK